jgi:hypothetical protein
MRPGLMHKALAGLVGAGVAGATVGDGCKVGAGVETRVEIIEASAAFMT